MAVNRCLSERNNLKESLSQKNQCIFISHQQKDKDDAGKIADYLIKAGIDVYFDEYDRDLRINHQQNNAKAVTVAIKKGINKSSHMLVLVSPNTLTSSWVPFEIGYGYDKTNLAVLCLKGIPKGGLPEYVKSATIIRDIWDINIFISTILDRDMRPLFESEKIFLHDNYNPLSTVMDGSINQDY